MSAFAGWWFTLHVQQVPSFASAFRAMSETSRQSPFKRWTHKPAANLSGTLVCTDLSLCTDLSEQEEYKDGRRASGSQS